MYTPHHEYGAAGTNAEQGRRQTLNSTPGQWRDSCKRAFVLPRLVSLTQCCLEGKAGRLEICVPFCEFELVGWLDKPLLPHVYFGLSQLVQETTHRDDRLIESTGRLYPNFANTDRQQVSTPMTERPTEQ